jgi:hypothetical protein
MCDRLQQIFQTYFQLLQLQETEHDSQNIKRIQQKLQLNGPGRMRGKFGRIRIRFLYDPATLAAAYICLRLPHNLGKIPLLT